VEGAFGPVAVPIDPQRVVATDFYTTYALLDVGYTVAGTAQATVGGVLPEYQQAYDAIPKVGSTVDLNYESIAAQRPDLILGTLVPNLPADLAQRLGAIAPALLFPAGGSPGTWRERAVRTADAVGRGAEMEQVKAAYEKHAQDIATRHADVLGRTRWGLVRGGQEGTALVDLPNSWGGVVLGAIGARLTAFAEGKEGASAPLSYEELGTLADCDVLLHLADTRGGVDQNTRRMLDAPTFRALPAVAAGRLFPLPNYYVSHYRQGDAVLTELEGVLGGLS
jgi:iron complex transport system substrate-binding protein